MTMQYATITGRVTPPGSDVGIRAEITATPDTVNDILKFASDGRITWGAETEQTDPAGNLTMSIPLNHGIPNLTWTFVARPLDRYPGLPKSWVMGHFEITASTGLDDLVAVEVDTVPAAVRDDLADVASGLAVAYSIAYDTDGVPYLTSLAGLPGSPIAYDTDGAPYLTTGA